MQKWEYRLQVVAKFVAAEYRTSLNEMGEDGWEFVTLLPQDQGYGFLVLFKRPKPVPSHLQAVESEGLESR